MTDISRNWYDLSLGSNILKSTYMKGVIDTSSNIVGQGDIWINNEKDEGNSSLGIGTNNPVNSINIQANEPCIDFTNSTITEPTNNNIQMGRVDFISPIRGDVTSSSIRCENMGDDYDNNGSLIFGRSNVGYDVVFFSSGNVGIGTTNAHQRLHVNGGIEFIMSNNNIGGVHCSGAFGIASDGHLYIKSNTKIVFGGGSTVNTSTNPSFNMNSVSPKKTNMVVTSSGVGINTSAPRNTLDVNGYMRVTGKLYAKYADNSIYSGWAWGDGKNEDDTVWGIFTGDAGQASYWHTVTSKTIGPGIWILRGHLKIGRNPNYTSGSVGVNSFGIGLGTNSQGNNYGAQMIHNRVGRFFYSNGNYHSNYARFNICRAVIIDSNKTVKLGVILGTNSNVRSRWDLYGHLEVWRVSNVV